MAVSSAQILSEIPLAYQQTAAEISAGVTPTNYAYPPGYVDRYATNTTPGTTDMSAAFSAAAQVAFRLGCKVRWGATAPYALNNPVNCTGIHGVVFEDESSGAASSSTFCSIIIGHTGHGFDLSASYECTFNNLAVKTAAATVPKTLFFCARNAAGSGAGIHRFNNIRVTSTATFSFVYYGYGSEENIFTNCEWYNSQNGSAVISHNATNPSAYTSTFTTIATGSQSNTTFRHIGCSYFNLGNSGSHNETVFALESASNFTFRDGLWANGHGDAYVIVSGTQSSQFLTFDSIRGEPVGTQPIHAVDVTATGVTHLDWTFNNVYADCSGFFLSFAANCTIENLAMRATHPASGSLINAYNMSDSIVETMLDSVVNGNTGGTISANVFIGGRNNVTANGGTLSGNIYIDNNTGAVGIDGDSYIAASAACTGALTVSVSWSLRLSPNGKQVVLALPATQGTTTAAASFNYGVAIPSQYRPSDNLRQGVIIEDSGGTLNQMGQVFINASTGVISVFKDIVGTANFTNGGTGGLPGLTEVTWNL